MVQKTVFNDRFLKIKGERERERGGGRERGREREGVGGGDEEADGVRKGKDNALCDCVIFENR